MTNADIYAESRLVTDLDECFFYHTMDVPGYGEVVGPWDLRSGVGKYLGNVDVSGKRVLDVGTATGFLCFHMERQGADVVAFDLSEREGMDLVPYARGGGGSFEVDHKDLMGRVNNSFWLCHRAYESAAKMVYGTVYAVPRMVGKVDVAVFGAILLHLRDPFEALRNALRLTGETVIITETLQRRYFAAQLLSRRLGPFMYFKPDPKKGEPLETWWSLSPEIIRRFIGVLGFEDTTTNYHVQRYEGRRRPMFTVVGRRTAGAPGAP